jgi:hypothetical protein
VNGCEEENLNPNDATLCLADEATVGAEGESDESAGEVEGSLGELER